MSGKRKVSDLQTALELFARRAKALTVENIESFPGFLDALFDEDALADPDERQRLAEQVRETIVGVVEGCSLATDRQTGNALFAIDKDLHGLDAARRVREVRLVPRTYYDHRKALLPRVIRELQKEFSGRKPSVADVLLSQRAKQAARQLYRCAQPVLICVDTYDVFARYSNHLEWTFSRVRDGHVNADRVPHGWLMEYCSPRQWSVSPEVHDHRAFGPLHPGHVGLSLAPSCRDSVSDLALWHYADSQRRLRVLLADRSGRDYLRGNLPDAVWWSLQAGGPFEREEVDTMLSVEGRFDDPQSYVSDLLKDKEGEAIHRRWLALLSAPPCAKWHPRWEHTTLLTDEDRTKLCSQLLQLCIPLQQLFPDETVPDLRSQFEEAAFVVLQEGLSRYGLIVGCPDTPDVEGLYQDVLRLRATRYEGRREGEPVWRENASDAPKVNQGHWFRALEGVDHEDEE